LVAVELGWRMAELYAEIKPRDSRPPEPPPAGPLPLVSAQRDEERVQLPSDLPGLGALRDSQRLALLFDQVSVGLGKLRPSIISAGLTVPANADWPRLAAHRHSPEGRYQLARAVVEFHTDLLADLTACDHQVGRAYGLGRAVADLCLRPDSGDAAIFTSEFKPGGRVGTIRQWLQELHTSLPPHAAGAVSGSIAQWQWWASQPAWNGRPLDWADHGRQVVSALEAQGKLWRLLLTGQAAPLDQLSPEDYVQAAGFLVGRVRRIGQRLLVQYWPWVTGLTALMVAAVAGSVALLHSPAAKGVGVAVSVLAWLGLTGRSLSAALGRTVSHVEQSLWQAELDLAAAWANTKLPAEDSDRQLGEARAPAFRLGSGGEPRAEPRPRSPTDPPAGVTRF
jgi:hypothetical protein